jgi:hypothetical protein
MKRLVLSLVVLLTLFTSALAYAQPVDIIGDDACKGEAASSSVCKNNKDDPITGSTSKLLVIANVLAWFGGAIAVIMIIYAGFVYVTSSGDDGKIKSAKNIILYSVVGLVVIVVSRIIVAFVIDRTLK